MQLHRNEALLKSRLRLSIIFFVASLVCLLGGFIVSTRLQDLSMQYAVSLSTLGFGITLWWQNKRYLTRWGPKSVQDATIAHNLKGVDNRYHLFSFVSVDLPDYLLVGPMGVLIVLPKAVTGNVSCNEGRWAHDEGRPLWLRLSLLMSPLPTLGKPDAEARDSVESVKRFLRRRLSDDEAERIPVEPIVVLTAPDVKLNVSGCSTEALYLRSLRSHVRRAPRVLASKELDALADALESA